MFDKIGRFSSRFRYPILAVWLLLAVLVTWMAPKLSEVMTSDQSSFLPESEESVVAAEIAAAYFPDYSAENQAVLVIEQETGSLRDGAGLEYLAELTAWLEQELAGQSGQLLSPVEPALADRLISDDGHVAMIFVGLPGSMEDASTVSLLKAMRQRLDAAPEGLRGYVTGSVAITDDYKSSALESADRTTWITIVLVAAILLVIYRSPVSPLIPLGTIGVAYLVSRGIIAWLTRLGLTVSSITDVFMVVLLFGAGTDYCLFLVSRFRELLAEGRSGQEAARHTVDRVGETITSSAGTVIVGMLAMSFAELKLFASTGPSLAIAVVIALLAGLTLTPALLSILGRWAFWPGQARRPKEGRFWAVLGRWVTVRPWIPIVLALVLLVPLAIYGSGQRRSFDMLADLPNEISSKAGFEVLSEHFGAGEMQPLDVIITQGPNAHTPEGLSYIHTVTQRLLQIEGVADVRSLTLPAGQESSELSALLHAEEQLHLVAGMLDDLLVGVVEPSAMDLPTAAGSLDALDAYLSDLARAFPELADNADHASAVAALQALQQGLAQGQQLLVSNQLQQAAAGISEARAQLAQADGAALADLGETAGQLGQLNAYLLGLVEAHPQVAELEGYEASRAALEGLETAAAELEQLHLLPRQLSLIASELESMEQALQDNPLALMPREDGDSPAEQMGALRLYLQKVGEAFPELAATADYAQAMALLAEMESALADLDLSQAEGLLAQFQQSLPLLAESLAALAATAEETMPQATFVPQAALPGAAVPLSGLEEILLALESALAQLGTSVAENLPQAAYMPADVSPEQLQAAADVMLEATSTLQDALLALADALPEEDFFLPLALAEGLGESGDDLRMLVQTYTASEGEAIRLQVVLADEPFSEEAMDTVSRLRAQVQQSSRGYVSGGTATYLDMRQVMERDTWRVMALVLAGILLVLVLLLRSLVAPIYMIATILLSYGATLGITRLVFDGIYHEGLNWFVPFLIFVVLVALGMDYNIFLMGRVKEEVAGNGTRAGIERAVQRTGGIITSAGIIMAGTFAAMMSSSLLGLVQLAFAITVGMLLDTFVIRTTLVPAFAALLDRWNWWPGKAPQRQ
ncbi:MAG: MMPL family transporter [Chloroflexia bacterium]|nr:MMPL family transporter [Chloroflexia bacterium]